MVKFIKTHDLYSVIKPLLYVSKAVGVAPFVLEGELKNRRLRISGPAVVYSVLVLLILLGRQISLIREIYLFDLETVFKTAAVIETVTYSISTSGFALMFLLKRTDMYKILHKLSLFDELFGDMERSYNSALLFLIGQMCLHLVVVLTLSITVSSYVGLITFIDFVGRSATVNNLPIILIVDTQLFNIMLLLKQRFFAVNLKITDHLNENHNTFSIRPRNSKVAVSLITQIPKVTLMDSSFDLPCERFQYLKNLHEFLCDISELVNCTYAIHMLLNVILKFIAIVFNIYFRLLRLLKSDKGQYSDDVWEWVMTGMLGWYVLKLGAIVWACASTAREVSCNLHTLTGGPHFVSFRLNSDWLFGQFLLVIRIKFDIFRHKDV